MPRSVTAMEESPIIELSSLPREISGISTRASRDDPNEDLSLKRSEQRLVLRALERARGNQTLAAGMLGITRDGLRYKMRKHGMVFARTRAPSQ